MPNFTDLPALRAEFKRCVPRGTERITTHKRPSRGHVIGIVGSAAEPARTHWRVWLELGWLRRLSDSEYLVAPVYERESWD